MSATESDADLDNLVAEGAERLARAVRALDYGSVTLSLFVQGGRIIRTELVRTESSLPAKHAEARL